MEELLLDRKKELIALKNDIKNKKKERKKEIVLQYYYIFLTKLRFLMPYIVAGCVSVSTLNVLGVGLPFYFDNEKKYKHIKKQIDNRGNLSYIEQFDEFENTITTFNYYSCWIENNEYYERKNVIYEVNPDDILSLYNKRKINCSDITGNIISSKIEKRNNLTKEEIYAPAYIEATIYYKDINEYIIVKENIKTNIKDSIIQCTALLCIEVIIAKLRYTLSKFDYNEEIKKIKSKTMDIELEKLLLKYEIMEENYNRLVR